MRNLKFLRKKRVKSYKNLEIFDFCNLKNGKIPVFAKKQEIFDLKKIKKVKKFITVIFGKKNVLTVFIESITLKKNMWFSDLGRPL